MRDANPPWLTRVEGTDPDDHAFEWDQRAGPSATVAVPTVVAAVTDRDPTALPPLNRAIDPDALGAILDTTDAVIGFQYADCHVHLDATGRIDVDRT